MYIQTIHQCECHTIWVLTSIIQKAYNQAIMQAKCFYSKFNNLYILPQYEYCTNCTTTLPGNWVKHKQNATINWNTTLPCLPKLSKDLSSLTPGYNYPNLYLHDAKYQSDWTTVAATQRRRNSKLRNTKWCCDPHRQVDCNLPVATQQHRLASRKLCPFANSSGIYCNSLQLCNLKVKVDGAPQSLPAAMHTRTLLCHSCKNSGTLELWNSPPWFTLNNSLPPARLLLSYFRVRPNFWIITEIGSQLMVLFL